MNDDVWATYESFAVFEPISNKNFYSCYCCGHFEMRENLLWCDDCNAARAATARAATENWRWNG